MDHKILNSIIKDIFLKCLKTSSDSFSTPITILFDNYGHTLMESFVEYCSNNKMNLCSCYVPYQQQLNINENKFQLDRILGHIRESKILINILNSSTECTEFRINIVKNAVQENLKILHLPGVSEELLEKSLYNLNYEELHSVCITFAELLNISYRVTINTSSCNHDLHKLEFDINEREAHYCGGIAETGEIMNLPTGETYIAPIEGSANGSIVINGSGPECVFHDREEVILFIEDGNINLKKCEFSRTSNSADLMILLEHSQSNDPNNYKLCEFGIGLNPTINSLTGEIILDEKKKGTVHIAFGNNETFGGLLKSKYHHDLMVIPDNILIDGKPLKLD